MSLTLGTLSSHGEPAAGGASRRVAAVAGLAGGAQVSGWLRVPNGWRVCDLLNNVREPVLLLESGSDGQGSLVLTRSNLVWVSVMGEQARARPADEHSLIVASRVVVHAGLFEIHGTLSAPRGIDWTNFLTSRVGPPSEFLPVDEAQVVGCDQLRPSTIAINASLPSLRDPRAVHAKPTCLAR